MRLPVVLSTPARTVHKETFRTSHGIGCRRSLPTRLTIAGSGVQNTVTSSSCTACLTAGVLSALRGPTAGTEQLRVGSSSERPPCHSSSLCHISLPLALCITALVLLDQPAIAATVDDITLSGAQHLPLGSLGNVLYQAGQQADAIVQQQLTGITPTTYAVTFGAGLFTSLSPCTLSVLPLTIGYIGGYSSPEGGQADVKLWTRAVSFSFGLATTLAVLGVLSSFVGKAYGQIGSGLPIAVSLVAIFMGLNLLEVLPLRLPSLDVDVRGLGAPLLAQAYLAGLTFALAASPCSTPVLATLLAYVSSTQDPVQGGFLLLAYTSGYVGPLLGAAAFTGAVKRVLELRQLSAWVTPASGALLLAGGTYSLLSRLPLLP